VREALWADVLAFAESEEVTVIYSTHDFHEAEAYACRVLVMDEGQIAAEGTVQALTRFIHEPSRQGVADPALRFGGGHGTQFLVARGTARFRVFAVLRGQGLIDGTAASAMGWLRAS
jgi:energy-coupling factor transporter ATP-binding protein EcfA2